MKKFLFIFIFLQGCAYYNTFYNAKKYYSQGLSKKKNEGSGYNEFFKKSAEKCEKLLNWFPNSKWADDALYLLGLNYFELGEYKKAKGSFNELINKFHNSKFLPYAYLYLAKINISEDEIEDAEKYLSLAKEFKIWDVSKEVAKEELKLLFKKGKTEEVIKEGESFLKRFPEKKYEILKILSDAYLFMNDTSKALYYLKEMNKETNAESTGLKIAKIYFSLDSLKKAIDFTKNFLSPEAKLLRGECFFKLGYLDSARNEVENLFQTRRDKYGLLASLILSDIYEKNNDSLKSYEVLKKSSNFNVQDSIIYFVKRKVNYLSLFYEKKDSLNLPEDTIIYYRFNLAEGYFIYKNDYKKAIEIYSSIKNNFNDTIFVPKSMMAIGFIYLEKLNDTLSAISTFEEVSSKFKGSIYSKSAEEIVGKIKNNTKKE